MEIDLPVVAAGSSLLVLQLVYPYIDWKVVLRLDWPHVGILQGSQYYPARLGSMGLHQTCDIVDIGTCMRRGVVLPTSR